MKKKRIFILLGHPDKEKSLNGYLTNVYEQAAREAGHEVRRTNLGDIKFDPIMHNGYRVRQELEPDLLKIQEDIKWCEHFVLFYPTWWSAPPALLKGMFDRMWLPGFAYNFRKPGPGWIKRLKGRSARMFVTSQSSPLALNLLFWTNTNPIRRAILWFSGFSPVRVMRIGNAEKLSDAKRASYTKYAAKLGRKGK